MSAADALSLQALPDIRYYDGVNRNRDAYPRVSDLPMEIKKAIAQSLKTSHKVQAAVWTQRFNATMRGKQSTNCLRRKLNNVKYKMKENEYRACEECRKEGFPCMQKSEGQDLWLLLPATLQNNNEGGNGEGGTGRGTSHDQIAHWVR